MLAMRRPGVSRFDPLPPALPRLAWPTRRRDLFSDPSAYIARTRANPDYGKPGWTRDCGRRFHRGCDIAPFERIAAGGVVKVMFSDCVAGTEYASEETAWIPRDDVFAVLDGTVVEVNADPAGSDLGCFVVLGHPAAGGICTLYAHLDTVAVLAGQRVTAGQRLGPMGRTSRSSDAQNWMSVAPHVHVEVIAADGGACDPLAFLKQGLACR